MSNSHDGADAGVGCEEDGDDNKKDIYLQSKLLSGVMRVSNKLITKCNLFGFWFKKQ